MPHRKNNFLKMMKNKKLLKILDHIMRSKEEIFGFNQLSSMEFRNTKVISASG